MSSRIEQIITEIEDYIDSCKFQPLSNTKILVNKEEIEELLVELRLRIPEEIKKYQKIISNQDAILQEARSQADAMVAEATAQNDAEDAVEKQVLQILARNPAPRFGTSAPAEKPEAEEARQIHEAVPAYGKRS